MVSQWWQSKDVQGTATQQLAAKLVGLREMLKEYVQAVNLIRDQKMKEALTVIRDLDMKECRLNLDQQEQQLRQQMQAIVRDEDLKIEMDWREKSR